MSAERRVVELRLDGDAVGTEELLVLDEVRKALAHQQGDTALTVFLEQLYQVVMNGELLELAVKESSTF